MRNVIVWVFGFVLLLPPLAPSAAAAPRAEPDTRFRSACPYPADALKRHLQGRTMISYRGTSDGAVTDVRVLESSGSPVLDGAAVRCVARWRIDAFRAIDSFFIGSHRAYINWTIPASGAAAGHFAGVPHNCQSYYPQRVYPAKGTTRVSFVIGTDGKVSNVSVSHTSGNVDLDNAALVCVQKWRYIPAIKAGEIVSTPWSAEIVWTAQRS